jgi:hypothetical protein
MLRAPTAVLLALCTLACNKKDEVLSTEPLELIPADLQGVYGRTPADAPGMNVTAAGLEYDQMQLTIHAGKMEGDTVRIERATLKWEKFEPKTCSGTIAQQGTRLLIDLYDDKREKCDPMLEAQWSRWEPLTELPELLRGRYNVLTVAADRLKLELDWFDAQMITQSIFRLPGNNDEHVFVLIDDAKLEWFDEQGTKIEKSCTGTIELADGFLSTDFWLPKRQEPVPGSPEASDPAVLAKLEEQRAHCKDWQGRAEKFEVSMEGLPKSPIAKQDVSLSITQEKVVLESPALRCEQELWRTESVPSGYGVMGGQRLTLGKAEPTGVSDGCKLNMRIWCERQLGNDGKVDAKTPPSDEVAECLDEIERELCPAAITVAAISDLRYKFVVDPPAFNELACVDTTGDFTLQK